MKIGVCIKQVPDTASKIRVNESRTGIVEEGIKFVMGPYDTYAVEEALRTKEKIEGSEVILFSVGPKEAQLALRSGLELGCDRAVHVSTTGAAPIDSLGVAKVLGKKLQDEGIEICFTGRQATDDDNAQVSQMTAEVLGWPHVTVVSKVEIDADGKKTRVERDVEGGNKEIWEVELPAILAATKGLNEPRYASLKGKMQAKKKPLQEIPIAEMDLPESEWKSRVEVTNYAPPAERKEGKLFKEDPEKAVLEVVRLLREEAKVI